MEKISLSVPFKRETVNKQKWQIIVKLVTPITWCKFLTNNQFKVRSRFVTCSLTCKDVISEGADTNVRDTANNK